MVDCNDFRKNDFVADGGDEINGVPVAVNEDGWTLMKFESSLFDSFVCVETICEMFPDYEFPPEASEDNPRFHVGYYLMKDGVMYIE